ncbi:MAG: hypothetical protein QXO75_07655 [Nitrososphaerota archaeon]
MVWNEINQRIKECRKLSEASERLKCLLSLWDSYQDGMVAYAIGEEYESQNRHHEALEYYKEAEKRFPLPKYKDTASNAIARVQRRLKEMKKFESPPLNSKIDLTSFDPKTTLIVVPCTKTKIWDEDPNAPQFVPARYAYCGPDFRKFVKLLENDRLESKGYKWLILSAKYGYIEPWHPIGNYDVSFNDANTGPISDDSLKDQVMNQKRWGNTIPLKEFRTVICFDSATYLTKVKESFKNTGARIIEKSLS